MTPPAPLPNRLWFRLLFALILALALTASWIAGPPPQLPHKRLPTLTAPTLHNSDPITIPAALRGEHFLLNIWGSWCQACHKEHPLLLRHAEAGHTIIGINTLESAPPALAWLEEKGDPYLFTLHDPHGKLSTLLKIDSYPTTYLIGPRGHILHKHTGILTPATIEDITRHLPEKAPSRPTTAHLSL